LKAELYSSEGDHKRALEIHDEAAKAAPEDVEVLNGRAIALARAGRPDEAASEFARIRAKVSDAMVLNNLCYTKAVANVALEQALDECEESLRIRPDVPAVLDSRGAVLLRLGRLDEAIRDFDRALTLVPGQDSTRYLRAVAKSRKGDAAGAKIDLEKVRATSPNVIPSMAETGFVMAQDP
jgi:Flp pilus assembly protein TadD